MYRTVISSIYKAQEVCSAIVVLLLHCPYRNQQEANNKQGFTSAAQRMASTKLQKQTNKITNQVSKIQWGNSELTINMEWVTTRLAFTVQLSSGKILFISHTQEYSSKPLFLKKIMPFKEIYHKATKQNKTQKKAVWPREEASQYAHTKYIHILGYTAI